MKSRIVSLSSCYSIDVREVIIVNSLQHMNNALNYIEENLTNEIDVSEIAKRALCSEYHFKRMFSFLAGVTLSEYIRRERLTLAAIYVDDRDYSSIDSLN